VGATALSPASITVTGFGPGSWGLSDEALGVSGFAVEDFEDVGLAAGLQIEVQGLTGGYGPSSTLPTIFRPALDDPWGSAFVGGEWDGQACLLNTHTNGTNIYSNASHWTTVTTFHFEHGASAVGFSLQQMQLATQLIVDGQSVGSLLDLAGLSVSSGRVGFVLIESDALIHSIGLESLNPDGFTVDHLVFVPAPAAGVFLVLPAVFRRRRA
jgi:hypothetical protein